MNRTLVSSVGGLLLSLTLPATAHHSFSGQYDVNKPITLTGIVTKVEWMNPHGRFYIDVEDQSGDVTNWNLVIASPNMLRRFGWNRNSLQTGDEVTVDAYLARDGTNIANATTVTLADGSRVFARDSANPDR